MPSFQQLLQQQQQFSPLLKHCLQRRLATRHAYLCSIASGYNKAELLWEEQVKRQEALATDRTQLGQQPSTHHISSLLSHGTSGTRSNRRMDVARSEEEMNRIIQSLIEQERENPETRWLATAALIPVQLAASSKCQFQDYLVDHNRLITPSTTPDQGHVDAVWTEAEERVFIERYTSGPKDFRRISAALPFKTTEQCVRFYYRNKRRLNLKALVQLAQSSASGSAGSMSSSASRKRSVYGSK